MSESASFTPRPPDEILIAEARKIGPTTVIGEARWLPVEHLHWLADALEEALTRIDNLYDEIQYPRD